MNLFFEKFKNLILHMGIIILDICDYIASPLACPAAKLGP